MPKKSGTKVRALANKRRVALPLELAGILSDPPLVGPETREEYDALFDGIAQAVQPADAIAWMYASQITDLFWEIKRQRALKRQFIESCYQTQIRDRLMPERFQKLPDPQFPEPGRDKAEAEANSVMQKWRNDPLERQRIDEEFANRGIDQAAILSGVRHREADYIDAIDRRITAYELRWMTTIRAVECYSEGLARRFRAASSEVIERQQAAE